MGTGLARLAHYAATGADDERPERPAPVTGLARFDRYGSGMPDFSNVESGSSTTARKSLTGSLRAATQRAFADLAHLPGPTQVPAIAARLARRGAGALTTDVREHGLGETASDIGRAVQLGPQESFSATLIGATDLVGADEVADRLRAVRERYREDLPIRTRSGAGARIGSRVATDIGQFVATGGVGRAAVGGAVRGLGRLGVGALAPRAVAGAANVLGRVAKPATTLGRVATDVGFAAPVNAAIGADQESSLLQAAAELTQNPTLERAARSTGLRIATELGVDAAASSLLQLLSRTGRAKLASEAAARKVPGDVAAARDVQRRATRAAETEQAVVESETQAAGTRAERPEDFDPDDVEGPAPANEPPYVPRPDEDVIYIERPYTPERATPNDRAPVFEKGQRVTKNGRTGTVTSVKGRSAFRGARYRVKWDDADRVEDAFDGQLAAAAPLPTGRPKGDLPYHAPGAPEVRRPGEEGYDPATDPYLDPSIPAEELPNLTPFDDVDVKEARRRNRLTPSTLANDTPERSAARATALDRLYANRGEAEVGAELGEIPGRLTVQRPASEQKTATLVMGLPSSGKSSVIVKRLVGERPWTVLIDADEAKKLLEGYDQGRGAAAVHPESAAMVEGSGGLLTRAIEGGDDIIWPLVGRTPAKLERFVKTLKAYGYRVHVALNRLPPTEAAMRAVERFRERDALERFVDPDYVYHEVGEQPEAAYEAIKGSSGVDRATRFNNDVPRGSDAIVEEDIVRPGWQADAGRVLGDRPAGPAGNAAAQPGRHGAGSGAGVDGAPGRAVAEGPAEPAAPGRHGAGSGAGDDGASGAAPAGRGSSNPSPDPAGRTAPPPEVRREVGPRLAGADGADDSVTLPDDSRVTVRYRVVEARELIPSHDAESFSPRPDYPPGVQGRRYHTDRTARENTVEGAQKLNPDKLIRDTGSAGGTPIITPDGIVLAGNQRSMMLQRASVLHPERMAAYRETLAAKAERFGVDPATLEGMEHPVLVREVTDPSFDVSDLPSLRQFNDLSDTPTQKARSTTDEAMARANRLRQAPAALEQFTATIQPDESLRAFLDSARGTAFVRALAEDGVFSRAELARYLDPKRDALTADGRNLIEQMMYAAAVGSPDILDRAPREVLNRLDGALPAIIRAAEVEGWSVQGPLQDALDLLKRVRDLKAEGKGVKSLGDLAAQGSLLDDNTAGQAQLLAEFLEQHRKKSVITEAFQRYAAEAEGAGRATQSFDVFGYEPPAPEAVFAKIFNGPIPDDPALRMAADSPLHPGWEGATAPPPKRGGLGGGTRALEPHPPRSLEQAQRVLRDPKEAFLAKHGLASPAYRDAERLVNASQKLSAEELARQAAERKAVEGSRDQFIEGQEEMFGDAAPPPRVTPTPKKSSGQGTLFLRPRGLASEGLPDAAPFRQGTAQTEAPHRAIERVTAALSEAMGLATREGKLGRQGKKALGIFKPGIRVIRTKNAADVGVFAHEVGHALHELFFGAGKSGLSDVPLKSFRDELLPMARGISDESPTEGWAEFWRRWIDNPGAAEGQAPRTWAYVNDRLHREFPGVEQALLDARERWRLFRESNAQSRIFSQISQKETPRHFSIRDWFRRRRTEALDDFAPIQRVVEALTGGKPRPEEDAITLARLTRGSHGAAEHFLERGTLDFRTLKVNGPSLEAVLAPVQDRIDEFRVYLVARRANELIRRGIETGLRPDDVQLAVTQLGGQKGFVQAADALYEYQDRLLVYLQDAGVMSAQTIEKIRRVNQSYVPFFRVHHDEAGLSGNSMIFGHLFNPTKRIKGSGREIIDPLESIIKNTYSYVHLAQKQEVSQALARLARRPGAGQYLEKIAAPMVPTKVGSQDIAAWLGELLGERFGAEGVEAAGDLSKLLGELDQHEVMTVFRPGDYFKAENTISVLENGKRQWYQVQPELYQALMGMDKEHVALWARILAAPAALLRAGATLAPEFIGRNPFRDQISAFVQSEYGFKPGVDMAQGLFHAFKRDDLYWQWKAAGGEGAALVDLDRKGLRAKLLKATRQQTAGQRATNVVLTPLRMLQALSAFMENATRIGEFRRAMLQEGTSKAGMQRSAAAAREVSTDFARHGSKTVNLRMISAFWNARLEGYDRLARAFKRRPAQTTAKAVAAITVPSIALFYLNKDDPDYWEVPQWQRDIFWLIPIGKDDTGHTEFMRVPKPFELGIIFGTIPERMLEWMHSQDATGLQRTLKDLLYGGAGESLPVPTAILPLAENYFNWSVFRKRPLVPRGLEEAHGRDQGTERNSPFARKLGDMVDYSPAKIDNLIFGYSAGLGNLAFRDVPSFVDRLTTDVAKPAATASDVPGVRGFAVRRPGSTSESVERFYDARTEARSDRASLRLLRKSQDEAGLAKREEELMEGASQARFYDDVADQLSDLRAQKRAIEQDPILTAQEKRRELDALDDAIVERAASAIGRRTPATPRARP